MVPSTGIPSTITEQVDTVRLAPIGRVAGEDGERVKLERMFKQMEQARKEELEKAEAVKEGSKNCAKTGRRYGSANRQVSYGEKYRKGM